MKHWTVLKRSVGVTLATIITTFTFGFARAASSPETVAGNDPPPAAAPVPGVPGTPDITEAPVTPVVMEKTLPPSVRPNGPTAEIVKLANSGVNASVMLAFITNSPNIFNLSAEEIIYLNDLGVPGSVVTAMIQHDQALKSATPLVPPAPEQVAPQPAYPEPAYAAEPPPAQPAGEVEPEFYDALAPYGNWVDVGGYGPCWQPTAAVVDVGWQPYFNGGRWVYSDCGWYWTSDYSWGWAPFHYGRWFQHNHLGWCWQPDRVWGPSWVCWRSDDRYCGWAPLPPGARFTFGIGLTWHGRLVGEHEHFGLRPNHFNFVAWNHFNDRRLDHVGLRHDEATRVFNRTTVNVQITGDRHNIINHGISAARVAAATHSDVHRVALHDTAGTALRGGRAEHVEAGGRSLTVYRPRLDTPPASKTAGTQRSHGSGGAASSSLAGSGSHPTAPARGNQVQPLILRGPDRPVAGQGYVPPAASAPSAPTAPNASTHYDRANRPVTPAWQRNPSAGTATIAPSQGAGARGMTGSQSGPNYQAPARTAPAPAQVPRYTAPAYTPPQRSYTPPPAMAAPARSAPSESRPAPSYSAPQRSYSPPPASSAPAHSSSSDSRTSSSSSSSSSGRNPK